MTHVNQRSSSPSSQHYFCVFVCFHQWHAVCVCCCVCGQKMYKSRAKDLLKNGCNELLRPDILTALCQSITGSKVNNQRSADPCPQTQKINIVGFCSRKSHNFISSLVFLDKVSSCREIFPSHQTT